MGLTAFFGWTRAAVFEKSRFDFFRFMRERFMVSSW